MRLDELARRAGVATTTVRLYQTRGLLPGPRLVGRTGYYDDTHLARLGLIARLQEEGFSLAGITRLLETWEQGRELADLVGVEQQLDQLLRPRSGVLLTVDELVARLPGAEITPEIVQRAARLGLVEPADDGRIRVPDERFLETGAAMLALGVPVDVILDEWAYLRSLTDDLATRFVSIFETHVLPDDWQADLDTNRTTDLAAALARLRQTADNVVAASLDASLARLGAQRLAELAPDDSDESASA